MVRVFDDTNCELGEGPLWHPLRNELFWFDILGMRLHAKGNGETSTWQFDEHVSAAGWVDENTLLIASETSLSSFNITTGESTFIQALEADDPVTRSNDGRADPYGGFWIGTMGKSAEPEAGAIYRYYKGELRKLFPKISISNAISFSPDKSTAYFTDTPKAIIWKVVLDADGWPAAKREQLVDLSDSGMNPDGAVCDTKGFLWNAQWGSNRAVRFAQDGSVDREVTFPAKQTTCPAFGGPDMRTMFMTSAAINLSGDDEGRTYAVNVDVPDMPEPQVIL